MNKYNAWCHKKPLIMKHDYEKHSLISHKINQLPISTFSKAALLQKEFLDTDGIEFIIFSNLKIDKHLNLSNGLEIVPCFYEELAGKRIDDPIYKASDLMKTKCRYLYDGWLPISNWEPRNISEKIRNIDEYLSLFSLTGHIYFKWEPKYFINDNDCFIIHADTSLKETTIVDNVNDLLLKLQKLKKPDRQAIDRSINWINKAKETDDVLVKFLFYMLSIEFLVACIENSKSNSDFYKLRTYKDKKEKNDAKRDCIKNILDNIDYNDKPWITVKEAYFSCESGIKKMVERQIKKVFKKDSFLLSIYTDKVNGKSLYDIRSTIAHGSVDTLNVDEIAIIESRIDDISKLSVNYVLAILYQFDIEFPSETLHTSFSNHLENSFLSNPSMFQGSTHMALRYYNRI